MAPSPRGSRDSWATGGFAGGGSPPLPYVFDDIPNQRLNHTAVSVNAGPSAPGARPTTSRLPI